MIRTIVTGKMALLWKSFTTATYPEHETRTRMMLFRSMIFLFALVSLPAVAQRTMAGQTYQPASLYLPSSSTHSLSGEFYSDPDFWLATTANLVCTGLFLTRVHAPGAAKWFG